MNFAAARASGPGFNHTPGFSVDGTNTEAFLPTAGTFHGAYPAGGFNVDVAPADLAHAPLVADAPQFRKGARVVARVGYNAVRAGDRGVVVGPCNVLTMPNASKRVLVDFGTGKGLYNYAAGTQLDVAADDAPGVFPSLNGA